MNKKAFNGILCIFLAAVLLAGTLPSRTSSAEAEDGSLIVVSMGDSYSSGEGVESFYGEELTPDNLTTMKPTDWLAHRSRNSWPGRLELKSLKGQLSQHKDINWFFVAASGATTADLKGEQIKTVQRTVSDIISNYEFHLAPQLSVFDRLAQKGLSADFVTITIGGNDAHFAEIIELAAKTIYYREPLTLQNRIDQIWNEFYAPDGIRAHIKQAYHDIQKAAGKQATIIVAGYPTLLDYTGRGVLFERREAEIINEAVKEFDEQLKKIIEECKAEGLNICFAPVDFSGHEAYTKKPWLSRVKFLPRSQDLSILTFSKYSMHPNDDGGIEKYKDSVQEVLKQEEEKLLQKRVERDMAETAIRPWSVPYRQFIRTKEYLSFPGVQFGSDEGCIQFALHDFERDGIPELLIGNGYDTHLNGGAYVFAYQDGQIRCLGDITSDPGGLGLFSSDDSYYTGLFWTESFQGSRGTLYYYIDEKGELARELVESGEFENRETFSGEYHLRSRTGDDALFALAREPYVIELVTYDRETIQRIGWDNFVAFYQRIWDSMMHWQTGEQHPGIPRGASVGKDPTPTPKKTPTPSPKKTPTPSPKKTPASAKEVWKRLYMDLIESGSYEQWLEINDAAYEGQGFALHDMDGDGTPELIFLDGGEWHQYFSQVCTIKNGSVQYMGRLRAPMGSLRGEDGDLWYHYYENSEYPGLFVEIPIAGYYKNLSDFYCGYFHVTPGGQIIEDVVEASASGSILEKTSDERLYRLIKNAKAIPLRFIELEDLLGGGWDRLWASWAGAPANTINH